MDADRREVIVRTSRARTVGAAMAVALLALVGGAWTRAHDPSVSPWLFPAIAAFFAASGLFGLRDTTPRLVLAPEGLAWRGRRKTPLEFLAWSEIAEAEIVAATEDTPRTLRLTAPRPALETVASEGRWPRVDIDIDAIDLPVRRLTKAIHDFAPHLFTRHRKAAAGSTTIVLGAEHDAALLEATRQALRELGARSDRAEWGVGGSQEVSSEDWTSPAGPVRLEAETYVGLSITGPEHLVTRIADRVRETLGR